MWDKRKDDGMDVANGAKVATCSLQNPADVPTQVFEVKLSTLSMFTNSKMTCFVRGVGGGGRGR